MTADWQETAFETRAIHAGQDPDPTTGAIITPIYQTSTFVQRAVGEHQGYEYARTDNPTRTALQTALASLEGGAWALAYASGLAATQNVFYLLNPGDHVLLTDDAYGGTHRFIDRIMHRYGIAYDLVDMTDLDAVRAAIRPETRLVWAETPTNPYLKIVDIAGVGFLPRDPRALFLVDNTFASPYLQNPLALGADLVLHSTTKYIGGHSDVVGGAVIGNDPEIYGSLKFHQNAAGAIPGPLDVWLALRGIKTLAIRMERHSRNARAVAEFLRDHPAVRNVFYPGLPDHPGHEIAARQMRDFSGMVSFTVRGDAEAALNVARSTRIFQLAESLGGVESLIEHPGQMTHLSVAGTGAEVEDTLIRLSVGIENEADLVGDLAQALEVVVPRGSRSLTRAMGEAPIRPYPFPPPPAALRPWNPRALEAAARVASLIAARLPDTAIEHVGSSSVPGCAGKGYLDLLIPFRDAGHLAAINSALFALGFARQRNRDPFPESRPMRTGAFEHDGKTFLLHVHIVSAASSEVEEFRAFRDRLRSDPGLMADYIAVKEAIVESGLLDSQDYAERKGRFIAALGFKGAEGG